MRKKIQYNKGPDNEEELFKLMKITSLQNSQKNLILLNYNIIILNSIIGNHVNYNRF